MLQFTARMVGDVAIFLLVIAACVSGKSAENLDGKIVGGSDVNIENFPYQVSLQNKGRHICGGSIISNVWVVTAAHCAVGAVADTTFRAGSSVWDSGGSVHRASERIVHTRYSPASYDYDVALYRVVEPFLFGSAISPIYLPSQGEPVPIGAGGVVSGWGTLTEGGFVSTRLQAVTVPVVSQSECQAAHVSTITPRMLCAGPYTGGLDACQGDSGGPLVLGDKLIGVVSWGLGCARSDLPGVYTRVSSQRDWIKTKSGV